MNAATVRQVAAHAPILLLGRPWRGAERYRPFFIVGSGRCGSTLLRAMLEAHPDLHIPPENPLADVVRDYRRYSRLSWSALLRVLLARLEFHEVWPTWDLSLAPVFRELAAAPPRHRHLAAVLDAVYRAHGARHKPGARRWGDKTPPNTAVIEELHEIFPDMQVIHLLRDGRDVVRSFLEWSRHDLAFHAAAWVRAVRGARAFTERHPQQSLELRYEDLVRDPRPSIERTAAFLKIEMDESMLRHHELDLRLGDVDRYRRLHGAREAVHTRSIGRWQAELNPAERAELEQRMGPALEEFGYRGPPQSEVN